MKPPKRVHPRCSTVPFSPTVRHDSVAMIPPKRVHPRSFTVTGVADETGVSAELWTKFKDRAAYAQYNPFVVALAAGTLKMESLLNYLGQDLYYLEKYIEACVMARDCEDNEEEKQSYQRMIEDTKDYAKKSQKTISAKESCPNMAAVDYTSFLLATAAGKVEGGQGPSGSWNPVETIKRPAYSMCSMTPCSRLYRFLAQQFADAVDFSKNPYKDWIEMIFPNEESPLLAEQMLDKLAKSLTEEERDSLLGRLYYHGLSFEIEFFSAVPLYQRTLVPLLKQGVKSNCRYTITLTFTVLESSKATANIPINALPSKKADTFDDEGLNKFLKQQFKVVEPSDPQGFSIDKKKARELKPILKKMDSSNVDCHIVSVHWSGDIIKNAFLSSGLDFTCAKSLSTSEPKRFTIFNNIESSAEEYGMQHISIYIGYDEDDLVSLLEADIGIVIGTNQTLKHLGESFGVSFVSLFSGVLKQELGYAEGYSGWTKESGTLYTVSSLSEICAFLVGSSN